MHEHLGLASTKRPSMVRVGSSRQGTSLASGPHGVPSHPLLGALSGPTAPSDPGASARHSSAARLRLCVWRLPPRAEPRTPSPHCLGPQPAPRSTTCHSANPSQARAPLRTLRLPHLPLRHNPNPTTTAKTFHLHFAVLPRPCRGCPPQEAPENPTQQTRAHTQAALTCADQFHDSKHDARLSPSHHRSGRPCRRSVPRSPPGTLPQAPSTSPADAVPRTGSGLGSTADSLHHIRAFTEASFPPDTAHVGSRRTPEPKAVHLRHARHLEIHLVLRGVLLFVKKKTRTDLKVSSRWHVLPTRGTALFNVGRLVLCPILRPRHEGQRMLDHLHSGICSLRVRLRTGPTSDGRTDKTNTRRFAAGGVQQAKPKPERIEKTTEGGTSSLGGPLVGRLGRRRRGDL